MRQPLNKVRFFHVNHEISYVPLYQHASCDQTLWNTYLRKSGFLSQSNIVLSEPFEILSVSASSAMWCNVTTNDTIIQYRKFHMLYTLRGLCYRELCGTETSVLKRALCYRDLCATVGIHCHGLIRLLYSICISMPSGCWTIRCMWHFVALH